jgi:hypothetical protein
MHLLGFIKMFTKMLGPVTKKASLIHVRINLLPKLYV